jgi:hypothetical protein
MMPHNLQNLPSLHLAFSFGYVEKVLQVNQVCQVLRIVEIGLSIRDICRTARIADFLYTILKIGSNHVLRFKEEYFLIGTVRMSGKILSTTESSPIHLRI